MADVNVFVSAAITPHGVGGRLLAAAADGRWQLLISPHLLAELERALGYEKVQKRLPTGVASRLLAEVGRIAESVPDAPEPWPAVTRDPKDDYLVALATSAGVDALVSGDAHLTELTGLVPPVMRPADFLGMVEGER